MPTAPHIAVTAASSVVPELEFAAGVDHLRAAGFDVTVHPHVLRQHFTYAGTDRQRADAFWELATDDRHDVVWMARGGYGAARLLPLLDELAEKHGPPPRKLLVGYSDVTVLHEYARNRWGWATLHAPMPAAPDFPRLDPAHWKATLDLVRGQHPGAVWGAVKWMTEPASADAELVGGNLALWASVVGTPFHPTPARGRFVFFEDIGERFYRIDRMVTQIRQAGLLDGAAALVLGDFTDCDDDPVKLVRAPDGGTRPLRLAYDQAEAFAEIFGTLGIPVATHLPVGHGPHFAPLPLGAKYRITPDGAFTLLSWDWLR